MADGDYQAGQIPKLAAKFDPAVDVIGRLDQGGVVQTSHKLAHCFM